jgi:hypothetical protein
MPKQAVLLIHGIGEQRPMETLRSFVNAVWTTDKSLHRDHSNAAGVWSKPYQLSENFELRRLTTAENRAGLRTDFFEFYWAHLMHGTKLRHVTAWAKTLLFRKPWTVPRHLRLAYWVLLILILFGVCMAYQSAAAKEAGVSALPVWASLALSLVVVPTVVAILSNIVGDAARYLHIAPTNVQRRHEIRAAGVEVIKSLHEKGYDRIVVVGHSLGSVIGYDILYYAWSAFNTDTPRVSKPAYDALEKLERLAAASEDDDSTDTAQIQEAQRRYLNEMKANQVRWRVTDFVTLGSPLAHAEILLARDAADLKPKFADRELAWCPPFLERTQKAKALLRRFSYPPTEEQRVPHHAAVFGPTRWTNLYFPNRFLVWGDLIGGKLRPIFGPGVLDIAVRTRRRFGFLSHTLYWTPELGNNQHLATLRATLDLLDKRNGREVDPRATETGQP